MVCCEESVLWCKFTIFLYYSPSQSLCNLVAHYDSPEGLWGEHVLCFSNVIKYRTPPVALTVCVGGAEVYDYTTLMRMACFWASETLPYHREGCVMFWLCKLAVNVLSE